MPPHAFVRGFKFKKFYILLEICAVKSFFYPPAILIMRQTCLKPSV